MTFGILDIFSAGQGGIAGIVEVPYEAIDFPLSHPTTPGFRRFKMRQERSQKVGESPATYQSQVQISSGERWVAEASLPVMKRPTAGSWQGFLNMLDGKRGTFMLGDSLGRTPMGNPSGVPLVRDAGQVGKTLTVKGATPLIEGWLKAGDYFQIGTSLYQVSRDANSDSSGILILDFWPRLRTAYAADTAIITANCKGLFKMRDVSWDSWEADERRVYQISFVAEEAL